MKKTLQDIFDGYPIFKYFRAKICTSCEAYRKEWPCLREKPADGTMWSPMWCGLIHGMEMYMLLTVDTLASGVVLEN